MQHICAFPPHWNAHWHGMCFHRGKKKLFWLTLQLRPGRKCHSLHQGLELVRDAEIQLQIIFCRNLPTYSTFVAIQKHAFSWSGLWNLIHEATYEQFQWRSFSESWPTHKMLLFSSWAHPWLQHTLGKILKPSHLAPQKTTEHQSADISPACSGISPFSIISWRH